MNDRRLEGAKVLILEDEYFIADDLARALHSVGAKTIGPAATIEQAKLLLAEQPVDAAILDLNLCGDMAIELVEELCTPGFPCVIVSGYGRESLPESLSNIPSLEKPVRYEKVVATLAGELGRASAPA